MLTVVRIGRDVAARRKELNQTQAELAKRAGIGLSTLDALENGRLGELGVSRIIRVLSALGLELKIQPMASDRPTLEELMEEESDDPNLDRQR
jgi:transcriptional regulator with XRE-family HTH domain